MFPIKALVSLERADKIYLPYYRKTNWKFTLKIGWSLSMMIGLEVSKTAVGIFHSWP